MAERVLMVSPALRTFLMTLFPFARDEKMSAR
jgi:hypothetical protein